MPRRHVLPDAPWAMVELLMRSPFRGRRWADHRTVVDGVLYWAATGVQWRDLPEWYRPWQTVYERFRRWQDDGTWAAILQALQGTADHTLGRGRGGLGTKLNVVACGNALPVGVALTPANAGETAGLDAALDAVSVPRAGRGRPRRRPAAVAGDKGYDHPPVCRRLRRRGMKVVIPGRRPHPRHRPKRGRPIGFDRAGSTGRRTAGGT